jgi:hypothetical protein
VTTLPWIDDLLDRLSRLGQDDQEAIGTLSALIGDRGDGEQRCDRRAPIRRLLPS